MTGRAARSVTVSNPDKALYPGGFTKQEVVDYYRGVAPAMIPHLVGRALTLRRFPNGVESESFYEKRCPEHRPSWMPTVTVVAGRRTYCACTVDDEDSLAWLANLAALELHPQLARADRPDEPTVLVFDLDPGAPAALAECAQVAVWLRELLGALDLASWPKASGSKGMQVYVPLNTPVTYAVTKPVAHSIARLLEHEHRDLVVSVMAKTQRTGRVFIDWSQNDRTKTTVAVYSLRARPEPTASMPLEWDEVEALARGSGPALDLSPASVLDRVRRWGDPFRPVAELRQELPSSLVKEAGEA